MTNSRLRCVLAVLLLFAFVALAPLPARGQTPGAPPALAAADAAAGAITASRDSEGRVVLRAFRVPEGLIVDGKLDESVYETIVPVSEFVQQEPQEGQPATEKTDVWILFDDKNLYVSARCWDSHPERMIVNDLRRDSPNLTRNENFAFSVDTFHDQRNGFFFQATPLEAIRDQSITDEGNQNQDWNTLWEAKTEYFDKGWTVEMVIPFKSLRYADSGPQTWGIILRRIVFWKNEHSFTTPIKASYSTMGIFKFSQAAILTGLETPAQSMNLEVKPYAITTLTTDKTAKKPYTNDPNGNMGIDLKYGLTRGLIADFTYNTDFAQVEDDVQQVNLTRFSISYPEKRDFFLEGQGIFYFGSLSTGRGGPSGETPVVFFSRRVGLIDGASVPVIGGGRLTGKVGNFTIGALSVQTDKSDAVGSPAENFAVVRVKREVSSRFMVGAIATRRSPNLDRNGTNLVGGIDANYLIGTDIAFVNYFARSRTPGLTGDDTSWRTQFDYNNDRYGVDAEHMRVGEDFNPEAGFMRRENFRRSSGGLRFSPRIRRVKSIRKLVWQGTYEHFTDGKGEVVESTEANGQFQVQMQNSDVFSASVVRTYELLPEIFKISSGVNIPVGGYTWNTARLSYNLGLQRKVSGSFGVSRGNFYGGSRTDVSYNGGRIEVTPRISLEPGITLNWINLPYGDFTTRLVSTRLVVTPTTRSLFSGLIQFNASAQTMTSNFRYRWEYRPGSELFVVYSDGRDAKPSGFPVLQNRSFAIKITRLVRF